MKTLLISLVSAFMLLAGGLSYAQDFDAGPGKPRMHKPRGMHGAPGPDRIFHTLRKLDLDENQQAEIRNIFQAMRAGLKPLMEEMRAGKQQLQEQIHSGNMDENVIAEIAKKEGELTTERVMITSKALAGAFAVLTDEQRAELQAMAEKHKARRGERRPKSGPEN